MKRDMLKLLTCAQGHYWEKPVAEDAEGLVDSCPVCGQPAETMPLLDLAPSETEAPAPARPPSPPPLRDKDGRPIVAGYEILQELGKGPTGIYLYKARQILVNRTVVLKVVFAGDDPGQLAWGSLRNEAGALGRLAHPNIVQILEAGERERQLFYNAVEHVDGPTLAEVLTGKPLPFRQALRLVETLARAVHHAHQKNIVHRSLKPASILLASGVASAPRESPPLADCTPKITDFGLARRPVEGDVNDAELQGERPCYLAPEQAWGRAKEIGPATDIYALGAILYELLAGQPPFRESTAAETLDAVQCREPAPLSRLRAGASGDAEAICRKCLHKQPRRRYASALDLAEDLRRCADGYPIKARDAGKAERFGKWLRRHARGMVLVFVGLCLGALLMRGLKAGREVSSFPPNREQTYRQTISRLETDLLDARRGEAAADYFRCLHLAQRAAEQNQPEIGREFLDRCQTNLRHWEWDYLRGRLNNKNAVADFAIQLPVACLDVSSDGLYLAVGGAADAPDGSKGEVSVWNLVTRQRQWQRTTTGPVKSVAFSPSNAYLALICAGPVPGQKGKVEAYHLQVGQPVFQPRVLPDGTPASAVYSSDSRLLLVFGEDGKLRLLHADNGVLLQTYGLTLRRGSHARMLRVEAPSDPDRLALTSPDGIQVLLLWDFRNRRTPVMFRNDEDRAVLALAYDSRNGVLAAGGEATSISLWNVRSPAEMPRIFRAHLGPVNSLSFSSDGRRLVSCGRNGTVRLWDVDKGQELLVLTEYRGASLVRFQSAHRAVLPAPAADSQTPDRLFIAHDRKVTLVTPPPRGPGPFRR